MKEGIHPKYEVTEVRCACGNKFFTRSTASNISLDICAACHPFFTGKQKLVDSAGRVDRFIKKASQKSEEKKLKKLSRAASSVPSRKPSAKKQKIKILSTSSPKARPSALKKKKDKKSV